jgi:hypothetical protein
MGHVDEQLGAHLTRNFGEPAVGNLPRIRAGARHDHLRLVLAGQLGHLVEVDAMRVAGDAVVDEVVELAGDVQLHPMREMAAVGQIEAQHGVAGRQGGEVHRLVGLRTGVRLHVGELRAE